MNESILLCYTTETETFICSVPIFSCRKNRDSSDYTALPQFKSPVVNRTLKHYNRASSIICRCWRVDDNQKQSQQHNDKKKKKTVVKALVMCPLLHSELRTLVAMDFIDAAMIRCPGCTSNLQGCALLIHSKPFLQ